jgi:hypothetical protein
MEVSGQLHAPAASNTLKEIVYTVLKNASMWTAEKTATKQNKTKNKTKQNKGFSYMTTKRDRTLWDD